MERSVEDVSFACVRLEPRQRQPENQLRSQRDVRGFIRCSTIKLACRMCALTVCLFANGQQTSRHFANDGWPEYGGTLAGQRFSRAAQITPHNVSRLKIAWTFHTNTFASEISRNDRRSKFEATPILWQRTLYLTSPYNEVFALDASNGKLRWRYDPKVDRDAIFGVVASRGVAMWHAKNPARSVCHDVVFVATLDRRMIALDARNGMTCPQFGVNGTVDLTKGIRVNDTKYLSYTSPPIIVGDTIVLGSSVADNQKLFAGSGAVRGFNAITGKQLWAWEPLRWTVGTGGQKSGSGNAWAPLAADSDHDLVFVPTGSASLDYFGGTRPGDNRDADSIVALRASTGEKVWAFQLVHHNLWDYDTASQPLLFEFQNKIPAIAVTNKTGMIYVFNRLTGQPLFPIVERPVPGSTLPGEVTWPTQPFSTLPPLAPLAYGSKDLHLPRAEDETFCTNAMQFYLYQGLFTPPSEKGSVLYPAALGGPNWGSSAFNPTTGVMYTRVSSLPYVLHLRPRASKFMTTLRDLWEQFAPIGYGGDPLAQRHRGDDQFHPPDLAFSADKSVMEGAPYTMELRAFLGPSGVPCGPQPFGRLVATDLNSGRQRWSVAHGIMDGDEHGSVGTAGPIATAGGLVFVSGTIDPYLRAYDAVTGAELWKGRIPNASDATPMTYTLDGQQFVVLATGGTLVAGTSSSARPDNTLIAFSLPQH
jgi:quinoprotein glucose dehydrogenase